MNEILKDQFYKAYVARDHRFDGKFFCAVKTTGIYCRPVCPAKPKRENVLFFLDALAAEKEGFRPCLRCRPECAPGSGGWLGKNATVKRALTLINAGLLKGKNEEEFALMLGVSARHLRRLFREQLGKSPKQISNIYRLNFARRLIEETTLPITEVAMNSEFLSIRRFNEAFKQRFSRSPSEFRKKNRPGQKNFYELKLSYRPPYNFSLLLEYYKNHLITGVEEVGGSFYKRFFKINNLTGSVKVTNDQSRNELILTINTSEPKQLFEIVQRVRHMFDVDADPMAIDEAFSRHEFIKKISRKHMGLRFPTCWDSFEASICTILGQLVSVKQARALVEQLVYHYGETVQCPESGKNKKIFPTAEILSTVDLLKVKTTIRRRKTIQTFSKLVHSKKISLDIAQDTKKFRENILKIDGVGPWTSEYICLRALRDVNSYPSTDLILNRVKTLFPDFDVDSIQPWRGYAAFYFWKEYADHLSYKMKEKK